MLIFSNTLEEHKRYVRDTIKKLNKARLHININKCEFYVYKTKYLGLIISKDGIRINPEKVKAIIE